MKHVASKTLMHTAIIVLLGVSNTAAQIDSAVETSCPSGDAVRSFSENVITIEEEKVLPLFEDEIAETDANWHKLSCGMSIEEVNSIVWLAQLNPETLRNKSRTMKIFYRLGDRELIFFDDRLLSARGPSAISLGVDTKAVVPTKEEPSASDAGHPLIRHVQKLLKESGYDPGPIDGIWGKKAESALRKYQRQNGLSETGLVDEKTRAMMGIELNLKK